jgi:hypothetical protein
MACMKYHMDSLIVHQSSLGVLCGPFQDVVYSSAVEANRYIPCFCFCLSNCATLSGVGEYTTHGAIPLGKVRALTADSSATNRPRRVDGQCVTEAIAGEH